MIQYSLYVLNKDHSGSLECGPGMNEDQRDEYCVIDARTAQEIHQPGTGTAFDKRGGIHPVLFTLA